MKDYINYLNKVLTAVMGFDRLLRVINTEGIKTMTEQKKYLIDQLRVVLSENQVITHGALLESPGLIGADNDQIKHHLLTLLQYDEIFILHNIADDIRFAYVWKTPES